MKRRGRPTKITNALTRRICDLLAKGVDQKTACNLAGVPYSTFNEWKQKGSESAEPFASFFSVISRARDEHKARLQKIILDAAEGLLPRHADWKAAAWALERGWPNEFAPFDRRPVPIEPEEIPRPSVALILNSKEGRRPISFAEAQARFANFAVKDGQPADGDAEDEEAEDAKNFDRWQRLGILPNT
jgi:hypothetical protein